MAQVTFAYTTILAQAGTQIGRRHRPEPVLVPAKRWTRGPVWRQWNGRVGAYKLDCESPVPLQDGSRVQSPKSG